MIRALIVFADGQHKIAPLPDWAPLKPYIFSMHPAGGESRAITFQRWIGDVENRETRTALFEESTQDGMTQEKSSATAESPAPAAQPPTLTNLLVAERRRKQMEQRRLDNARVAQEYKLVPSEVDQ